MPCPDCGALSTRRHSGYRRRLADGAVGGQQVCIELAIRHLFCGSPTESRYRHRGRSHDHPQPRIVTRVPRLKERTGAAFELRWVGACSPNALIPGRSGRGGRALP
ncbi:transposase family protein [Streptomyces mirabilis]|uniref:transposase family protein n=1 Tax=Streptomyces mirabilis TaxID=68239 RepID=UPI0036C9CB4E